MSVLQEILKEPALRRVRVDQAGNWRADVRKVGKNIYVLGSVIRGPRRKKMRRCTVLEFGSQMTRLRAGAVIPPKV